MNRYEIIIRMLQHKDNNNRFEDADNKYRIH